MTVPRLAPLVTRLQAETLIAQAQRDFQMNKAQFDAAVNLKRADADLAYDIQRNRTSQELKKEEVQIEIIAKEQQIKRLADAERYRVETETAAHRQRAEQIAKGEAEARRQKGMAEADVIRATGTSEAEIIALKGASEADAMRKKADSFREYNQAAVLQILVAALPEIARAVAEPLSKTARITLVSTGGDGIGASTLTGDIAKAMAEIPAVVESLSGIELRKLVEAIPALKSAMSDTKGREGEGVRGGGRWGSASSSSVRPVWPSSLPRQDGPGLPGHPAQVLS